MSVATPHKKRYARVQRIAKQPTSAVVRRNLNETTSHGTSSYDKSPSNSKSSSKTDQYAMLEQMGHTYGNSYVQRYVEGLQRSTDSAEPMLRVGSRSPAVSSLQQYLVNAGAIIAVDGIFGPQTQRAVVAFQRAAKLAPDGVVGSQTWGRLKAGGVQIPASNAGAPAGTQAALIAKKLATIRGLLHKSANSGLNLPEEKEIKANEAPAHAHDAWGHDDDSWLDSAGDWLDEKAESASDWVGEKADAAGDWVDDKVDDASDWVSDKVDSASDWVDDKVDSASDWVEDKVDSASDWVSDKVDSATDWVSDKANEVVDWGKETASEAWNVVTDLGNKIVEDIKNVVSNVKGLVDEALDVIIGLVNGTIPANPLDLLDDLIKKLMGGGDDKSEDEASLSGTLSPISAAFANLQNACDDPETSGLRHGIPIELNMTNDSGIQRKPGLTHAWGHDLTDASGMAFSMPSSKMTKGGVEVDKGWGRAVPSFHADMLNWAFEGGKLNINGRFYVLSNWDIAANGCTDITSAEDSAVKESNWKQIVAELTPTSSGAPQRQKYWSSPLTEQHEFFHCAEYVLNGRDAFASKQSTLNNKVVNKPFLWISDSNKAEIEGYLNKLLQNLTNDVGNDVLDTFINGGEARAYGAGESGYQKLVDDIKARAKREKWDKPTK